MLLAEQAAGRDLATIRMRRRASGLPAGKTFDAWDEDAAPIPKPRWLRPSHREGALGVTARRSTAA